MGSGSKASKKDKIDMGFYSAKEDEQKAYAWCIKNNIFISPKAKNSKEWYIDIELNKKVNTSPITYEKVEIWKQIFKFYVYYYNKYHKIEVKDIGIIKPIEEKKIAIKQDIQNKLF